MRSYLGKNFLKNTLHFTTFRICPSQNLTKTSEIPVIHMYLSSFLIHELVRLLREAFLPIILL